MALEPESRHEEFLSFCWEGFAKRFLLEDEGLVCEPQELEPSP